MKTKFYAKKGDLYILMDSRTGVKSYILHDDVKKYQRPKYDGHEILMVYDDLKHARMAVATQFINQCHTNFPDGLAIEEVESKFFGLWKRHTILPVIDSVQN